MPRTACFSSLIPVLLLPALLGGCGPRLIAYPYDPAGRSLNSPFSEITPRLAGHYLVFASDRRGSQDIYLFDTSTRSLIDLPGLNAIDMVASNPAVSENGRLIVFVGSREGRTGVYLYDRETRQLRNLTENLRAEVRNPSITADGNMVAFQSNVGGKWEILFYNRFGQPLEQGRMPP
jgi:Tol biopolymer transport system component